jgi:hypothetical protein
MLRTALTHIGAMHGLAAHGDTDTGGTPAPAGSPLN